MTPDVVVDIGNSRMKWGVCSADGIAEFVSLDAENRADWDRQDAAWEPSRPAVWAVASVHPQRLELFREWATARGDQVRVIQLAHVPMRLKVDEPESVGVDRLLTALAAHRAAAPRPVIAINVGTATTCDLVDEEGVFLGGAILPGPQMMARALHDFTAKLPLIDASNLHTVACVGTNTRTAIELGILSSIGGAFNRLIPQYSDYIEGTPVVFFTGGGMRPFADVDADKMWTPDPEDTRFVPTLTLEGIRIAAEALP